MPQKKQQKKNDKKKRQQNKQQQIVIANYFQFLYKLNPFSIKLKQTVDSNMYCFHTEIPSRRKVYIQY